MNSRTPEQREGAVDLAADEIHVRAGFRVVTGELLAGGPVELEFFVESLGSVPLRLVVSGDRMRLRPGQFSFSATFEGLPLEDPMAAAPYMGGPAGVVQVSTDSPWRQPLVLNQFIRLEGTPGHLGEGATGRIDLACRRPLALAATEAAALSQDGAQVLAVDLAFDLRRDDAALASLVAHLFDEVMQGPLALREQPLALLLSMRTAAHAQIDALTRHPDPSVAGRARQTTKLLTAFP
jgi:hypothetical protein